MNLEQNRIFFALWPDDAVRAAAAQQAKQLQQDQALGGRLIKPLRYHLTLQFLGDTVPEKTEALAGQAASAISVPGFEMVLDQAGSFPNREIPCWLSAGNQPAGLSRLYSRLERNLLAAGVRLEPVRFRPHLTVLREASRKLASKPIPPIRWPVTEFVMIRSVLHRWPAEYQILGRFPLGPIEPEEPSPLQGALF